MPPHRHETSGFTLVELVIVVLVTGIMIGLLFGPLNSLYKSNNDNLENTLLMGDTKSSLRSMEQAVNMSDSFLGLNAIPDPTRTAGWNSATGDSSVFILSGYATSINTAPAGQDNRKVVYATNCSDPLKYNYVYFLDSATNTLFRRTLAGGHCTNTGSPVYVSPSERRQKRTCATITAHSSCEARDAKILTNVTRFSVTYFNAMSQPITTPISSAKSVSISVSTSKNGKEASSTVRFKRVNGS